MLIKTWNKNNNANCLLTVATCRTTPSYSSQGQGVVRGDDRGMDRYGTYYQVYATHDGALMKGLFISLRLVTSFFHNLRVSFTYQKVKWLIQYPFLKTTSVSSLSHPSLSYLLTQQYLPHTQSQLLPSRHTVYHHVTSAVCYTPILPTTVTAVISSSHLPYFLELTVFPQIRAWSREPVKLISAGAAVQGNTVPCICRSICVVRSVSLFCRLPSFHLACPRQFGFMR